MSKKKDAELAAIIIPENEYQLDLEEKVAYYMSICADLPINKVKPQRTKPIDTRDPHEKKVWEREEIRRCMYGHFGMSGPYYFFYNYCKLWDIENGLIRPEFRFAQNEFFRHIRVCQDSNEWGVVAVKRRRVGASWMVCADVLWDCIFTPFFKVGMTSKTEADAKELFKKVKFLYDNLPEFLQAEIFSQTVNSIEFATKGEKKKKSGLQSEVVVKAPTETSWEGFALKKLVVDECFGAGTMVKMADGNNQPIESIKTGDYVMGADSKPRLVINTTTGYDEMYQITPKKGNPWTCNSKHLLTVKFNGEDKVIDIPAADFYKMVPSKQRYHQMFRKGVDYEQNTYKFDPYWMGLWLGDGHHKSASVCTMDPEIGCFLNNYRPAGFNNVSRYSIRQSNNFHWFNIIGVNNGESARKWLRELGVFGNKHIPECYLKTSRPDRLKLLAGIIDSDGHKDQRKDRYEVTFKSQRLSLDTQELCLSLGLNCSFNSKVATMRRKDGSIYKCEVYRLGITGNILHEIPCRVPRKQVTKVAVKTRGRKDPQKMGFEISKAGFNRYYGITLQDDPYFLLADYTVVHNCGKVDKLKSIYSLANETMRVGTRRVGTPVLFGTAGDIGKEGKDLMEMWYNSDVYKLKRFFFAGYMGLIVDDYGNDLKEHAIRWIIYERKRKESLSAKELTDFIQQYPLTVEEAFKSSDEGGLGNRIKIEKQRVFLLTHPMPFKKGSFRPNAQGNPVFSPDPRGACVIYEEPDPSQRNLFCSGVDPTDHVSESKKTSSLSMFIMSKPVGLQPPKIVFKYTDRPVDPRDFYEQALLALKYYGDCRVLIERNKYGMIQYFEEKGYKYLLVGEPQGIKKYVPKVSVQPGYYKTQYTTQYGEELIEQYIEDYYEVIPCVSLLDQFDQYGIQNCDEVDAFMACLMYMKDDKEKVRAANEMKNKTPNWSYKWINGKLQITKK